MGPPDKSHGTEECDWPEFRPSEMMCGKGVDLKCDWRERKQTKEWFLAGREHSGNAPPGSEGGTFEETFMPSPSIGGDFKC